MGNIFFSKSLSSFGYFSHVFFHSIFIYIFTSILEWNESWHKQD